MNKMVRKESSVPVTTRVSIVDLARMDYYWMRTAGVQIKTMSQLVSWTVAAMIDVLEAGGSDLGEINTVREAHQYLEARELYQAGTRKKAGSRIVAALGMEALREQGDDPAFHHARAFKTIHSRHSSEAYEREPLVKVKEPAVEGGYTDEEWQRFKDRIELEKKKERQAELEKVINEGRLVASEEGPTFEEMERKGQSVIEKENAPLNLDEIKTVDGD